MMKRIGIFAFYDKNGAVDDYKLYLLKSLMPFLTDLIIAVNGVIEDFELNKLREYTEDIFIRENRGYDGGAYKDVLTGAFRSFDWTNYDEILLFNDTFYGPLFSWESVFSMMSEEGVDFWGLSRNCGGTTVDGTAVTNHVQSFFLAVGKSMFQTPQWARFWKEMEYPASYWDAVKGFEIYFTRYFAECGFRFSTWLDRNGGAQYIEQGKDSPYVESAFEIIEKCRFPVVKYRAMTLTNYGNVCRILDHVKNNSDYPEGLILRHMERMEKEGRLKPFGVSELEEFVLLHQKIFIFGHGQYGRGLAEYFQTKGWEICGFVVSKPKDTEEIGLNEVVLGDNDGLVVALGEKNLREVRADLEGRFRKGQILFPRI